MYKYGSIGALWHLALPGLKVMICKSRNAYGDMVLNTKCFLPLLLFNLIGAFPLLTNMASKVHVKRLKVSSALGSQHASLSCPTIHTIQSSKSEAAVFKTLRCSKAQLKLALVLCPRPTNRTPHSPEAFSTSVAESLPTTTPSHCPSHSPSLTVSQYPPPHDPSRYSFNLWGHGRGFLYAILRRLGTSSPTKG
jgi:hypothetical protein